MKKTKTKLQIDLPRLDPSLDNFQSIISQKIYSDKLNQKVSIDAFLLITSKIGYLSKLMQKNSKKLNNGQVKKQEFVNKISQSLCDLLFLSASLKGVGKLKQKQIKNLKAIFS